VLFYLLAALLAGGGDAPPEPQREFRAVWVATVANIDWPSKRGLSVANQKKELIRILDQCKNVGLNAVIFQVRPMCDALYESKLEPWSIFLTGTAGKAAEGGFDPLSFAIEESHKRGMELHAWFNPYRAWHKDTKDKPPSNHIANQQPEIVKRYGSYLWLDPGEPATLKHSLAVIQDVVQRYDVDGIHVDDYFYPYPEKGADGNQIPFPDDESYAKYTAGGGKLQRDDWRRQNVNQFVQGMYDQTKKAKPWVKVGISPFGIWRPGNPPQIKGFDQYAQLYADAKLWVEKGWLDYNTPQLYWPIRQEAQSYPVLLAWWAEQNKMKRHLWPGDSIGRVSEKLPPTEWSEQIAICRKRGDATGNVHFSMKPLLNNKFGIADELKKAYAKPALVPESPWLVGNTPPSEPPTATIDAGTLKFGDADPSVRTIVASLKQNGEWTQHFIPASAPAEKRAVPIPSGTEKIAYAVVDRFGQLTPWREMKQ
jgi:uncharacterized lipoprotein YddW (UPF0748 family)